MSAVVCGSKRSFFEDPLVTSDSPTSSFSKRLRFSSPVRLSPLSSYPKQCLLDRLREIFPDMDGQLFERVLEERGNDLDSAIKSLHELCLGSGVGLSPAKASDGKSGSMMSGGDGGTFEEASVPENPNTVGAELVELIVQEMMSASSVGDARARATKVIGNFHKEYVSLKEQRETLIRENSVLKHAVIIQHERQKEHDERSQELQHLRQLTSQYQEQMRTLEVNNYALTMHLKQAQQSNSIPGRFHPDVF